MQLASSRIRTRAAVSISYDDNHYTTGTSTHTYIYIVKEYIFTYFKDDLQWWTVFIVDFVLLNVIYIYIYIYVCVCVCVCVCVF